MQHSYSHPVSYPLAEEGFQVWLGNLKLSSHPTLEFLTIFTVPLYSTGMYPIGAFWLATLDWDVCAAALTRLPTGRRCWISKHMSGFCSIGTKMVKWKEQLTPACTACCGLAENARHVWLCQDPVVFFVWALLMSALSDWMVSVNTATEMTFWIILHITEWRSSEPLSQVHTGLPGLFQAMAAQDHIGWLAVFEGCIAPEWTGVQDAHYLWLGRRNTGKRWATSLVVKLWEVAWDLWNHRNQVKFNLETAQDIARCESILAAVRSEYSVSWSSLPRQDWRLFQCPLLSILSGSLHYLDAWLLRVKTARSRQARRAADLANSSVNTAEEHLPNLAGSPRIFQQFLDSISLP
jgi:hypothetical protein